MSPEDEIVHDMILDNMVKARQAYRREHGSAPGEEIYIEMSRGLAEKLGIIKCD